MPKTLSKDSIIEALSKLNENDLMEVAQAVSKEVDKRDKDLEQTIKAAEQKRETIRTANGGGK